MCEGIGTIPSHTRSKESHESVGLLYYYDYYSFYYYKIIVLQNSSTPGSNWTLSWARQGFQVISPSLCRPSLESETLKMCPEIIWYADRCDFPNQTNAQEHYPIGTCLQKSSLLLLQRATLSFAPSFIFEFLFSDIHDINRLGEHVLTQGSWEKVAFEATMVRRARFSIHNASADECRVTINSLSIWLSTQLLLAEPVENAFTFGKCQCNWAF